jgi:NADH-quinone oxidoreductase subunit N
VIEAGDTAAYALAVVGAVNTVIAAAYYMRVMRQIWMAPTFAGDTAPIPTPPPIVVALGITAIGTVVLGVLPGLVLRFGDIGDLTGALGR